MEKLIGVNEIAEMLGYKPNSVQRRVVTQDGFPTPVRLPNEHGERVGRPRWFQSEVMEWLRSHQSA